MSIRLTNSIRRKILAGLIDHKFGSRRTTFNKELVALGDAVYHDVYKRDLLAQMRALPDGFLVKADHIKASFGGRYGLLELPEPRVFGNDHAYNGVASYGAKDPLSVRYYELDRARDKLNAEEEAARAAARSALWSCGTVSRLLKVWPECLPFVTDHMVSPVTTALTIQTKDLNKLFGLK